MKYRPGDRLVVTRVPDIARWWARVGDVATVLQPNALPGDAMPPDGLIKVQINSFEFWWAEDDCAPGWAAPAIPTVFAEPRGYDPYNSATTRADVWRTERVTRVRLPPPRRP